eukprot:TRINITY_DN20480_c0_g1_i2.p1 TRINITY_DN20480_c0_g1~~TRINITY_DN20480_c0_g1_i2.p1  ORF type:complete len:172 (-),score=21.88 TRINITY_DN20480_c0_g1_i2:94-609(-)
MAEHTSHDRHAQLSALGTTAAIVPKDPCASEQGSAGAEVHRQHHVSAEGRTKILLDELSLDGGGKNSMCDDAAFGDEVRSLAFEDAPRRKSETIIGDVDKANRTSVLAAPWLLMVFVARLALRRLRMFTSCMRLIPMTRSLFVLLRRLLKALIAILIVRCFPPPLLPYQDS